MVQKDHRQPRHTDREWLNLIQECRTNGMSDKDWCDLHHIQRSSFYYHIRRFRDNACPVPEASLPVVSEKQVQGNRKSYLHNTENPSAYY